MEIAAGDMAVSARVLIQVFLVVLLRREEIPERFKLHGQLCAGLFFLGGEYSAAYLTNLMEQVERELPIVDGEIELQFKPYEILTVMLEK